MPLSKLNQEQQSAATAPFGHNLIIASAGTGKTSTIVARIAHLLESGTSPQKIMLLTFTNKASKEMIGRLEVRFGKKTTGKILAGTFHSVAYSLLRALGHKIVLKPTAELKTLLKSIYERRKFHHLSELKPYMPSYLYDIYSLFQNRGGGENFAEFIARNYGEQGVYADIYADILREFEDEKKRFGYVDFNDLLLNLREFLLKKRENSQNSVNFGANSSENSRNLTLGGGENSQENATLNEPHSAKPLDLDFDEILVDEYQDTNALQGSLIEAFGSRSLFCVGDYDQSIYAFNGADIGIIGSFAARHKDAKIYTLTRNYRSSKSILALANRVIEHNERLYPKQLIVTREGDFASPCLLSFAETSEQYAHIAALIAKSGTAHENIAVIFRNNSSADGVELALRELGVASQRKESVSFFESLEVKAFCAMFALILNPKDLMAFMSLMEHSRGVGAVLAKEIFDALLKLGHGSLTRGFLAPDKSINLQKIHKKNYELGLFDDIEVLANAARFSLSSEFNAHPILSLPKINEACAVNLERLWGFVRAANGEKNSRKIIELIRTNAYFKDICGLLADKRATNRATMSIDAARKAEAAEKIERKMSILGDLAAQYTDAQSFYNFLTLGASELGSGKGVNLLSIHASKGLEFELVFVVDLAQNRFPNSKLMAMGGSLEEERRLFYVAVTRAKNTLYLSYAKHDKYKHASYSPSCFLIEAGLSKGEKI